MLKVVNYSSNRSASTMLTPEIQDPARGKVLIINTRSYYSDLMEQEEKDDEVPPSSSTVTDSSIAPRSVHKLNPKRNGDSSSPSSSPPSSSLAASTTASVSALTSTSPIQLIEKKREFFIELLEKNDDLHKDGVPEYDVAQVPQLMLSADQGPEEWVQLAQLIERHYFEYDGFVVQNGSDGMVYTATALSFMLENLGKPVIFTGSLIPATRIYTDMKRNTILSLILAACRQISEVCILFDDKLYRANRSIKVSRCSLKPYDSPHYPPLARMAGSLKLWGPLLRPQPHGRLHVMPHMSSPILSLPVGPYAPLQAYVTCIERSSARALVLACYGSGNAPSRGNFIQTVMAAAAKASMLVVITTQNCYGKVKLGEYELGRQLQQMGAISAREMTSETTYIKLKYLFGCGYTNDEVRSLMERDLRGELTFLSSM